MIDSKSAPAATDAKWVPTYCYNCVAGPDLLTVKVQDGVATEIAPNFAARALHPGDGRPCVKAYGLIQKTYSPHRILTPMRRTNPRKGIDEDPGFEPISWDEALDLVAAQAARDPRQGHARRTGPAARRRQPSDTAARRPTTWERSPPSSPPGVRSTSASARARA